MLRALVRLAYLYCLVAMTLDHPLSLLDDPMAYVCWQHEVGAEEAQRQLIAATRAHMQEHGPRSALDIAEKMEDATAVVAEFVED